MSRRDEARAKLIRAGLALAEKAPFRDLTVEEVAGAAGLSRSAFYVHFPDKHELLVVALEDIDGEFAAVAEEWWRGEAAPVELVRSALSGLIGTYAEHARVLAITTEVATYDDRVRGAWLRLLRRFIDATARQIARGQRGGLIADGLDPVSTAEALVWMSERCAYIYLTVEERSAEEVVEQLASVWVAALYPGVTPAGELRPDGPGDAIYGVPAPDFARRSPGSGKRTAGRAVDKSTGARRSGTG